MLSNFDALLIILSIFIFIRGVLKLRRLWRLGKKAEHAVGFQLKRITSVFSYILSHRQILKCRGKGTAHLFIFWGFFFPLVIVLISQFNPHSNIWTARILSFALDFIGIIALFGTILLSVNKYKPKDNDSTILHLIILIGIFITGFFSEALRLKITGPQPMMSAIFSPFGYGLSFIVPASPVLHKLFIRGHFLLVLVFVAFIPFSNMRHAILGLLNIYYRKDTESGRLNPILLEGEHFGAGNITDFSRKDLLDTQTCVSCGRCDLLCPAFLAQQPLSPLVVLKKIRIEMESEHPYNSIVSNLIGHDDIWACTTCLNCVHHCPIYIDPLDKIIQRRRHAVLTESNFPQEYKTLFKNMEIFGDSLGSGKLLREDWTNQLQVPKVYHDSTVDTLFWVGCISSLYSERSQRVARAAVNILNKTGFRYGILGKQELCCGDPARRLGNEYLFQSLVKKNIDIFKHFGVRKIITLCPHCFNIFKNEYKAFGAELEVIHLVELIDQMLENNILKIKTTIKDQLTYHDPCYLGRYNTMYHTPRSILQKVMASNLKEMPHNKEKSLCCGAGGGNFWKGKITGKRIEKVRFEEAEKSQVDGLVSACPFCTLMFESACQQRETEKSFKVLDILEIVDHVT